MDENQPLPTAPPENELDSPSTMETLAHKTENLKMKPKNLLNSDEQSTSSEWTVVYSDSGSSILSNVEEDNDDKNAKLSDDEEEEEEDEEARIEDDDNVADADIDSDDEYETHEVLGYPINPNWKLPEYSGDISMLTPCMAHLSWNDQPMEQSTCSDSSWIHPNNVDEKMSNDEQNMLSSVPISLLAEKDYESSDIDIINDDDEDLLDPSLNQSGTINDDHESILSASISSVISQTSNLSLLREQYLQQHLQKQKNNRDRFAYFKYFGMGDGASTSVTDDELIAAAMSNQSADSIDDTINTGDRIRAYVHTPNTVLNGKLNLILILSVTAVVGLGIGHFIGWSNQWRQAKQLSMGQVIKLKQLQDDLLVCLKSQDSVHIFDESQVCHRDSAYWKERIENLFNENKGLIELFQKTQKHFNENGHHNNVIGEAECVNKTTSEAFHMLKLDMLVKQMEHLKLLDKLEKVKREGEKRIHVLEEENQDLKQKLVEEEFDDLELEHTWGNRVVKLQNENEELRKTIVDDDVEDRKLIIALEDRITKLSDENSELLQIIERLEQQFDSKPDITVDDNSELDYSTRYSFIRDQINQLMSENEDLRNKVAHYRWISMPTDMDDDSEFDNKKMKMLKKELKKKKYERKQHKYNDKKYNSDNVLATMNQLQHQLEVERNDVKRWKERFETLVRHVRNYQITIEKSKRQEQRQQQNQENLFPKDGETFSNFHDIKNDQYETDEKESSEEQWQKQKFVKQNYFASLRKKWKQHFKTITDHSEQFLNGFVNKVRTKWDRFNSKFGSKYANSGERSNYKDRTKDNSNNNDEKIPLNGDNLIKLGQFLENAFMNVHNFSERILHKGMQSEVVTYLADRMNNFASLLEKNFMYDGDHVKNEQWPNFKSQNNKDNDKEPSLNSEFMMPTFGKDDNKDSSPPPTRPPYPSIKTNRKYRKDWQTERAKAREKYRQTHE
ncbi:hypothetical protein BLOT_010253 [Blomia tropicalis]|nr:hypothetical protein BLOT_010253 [Blomia tropicalis]